MTPWTAVGVPVAVGLAELVPLVDWDSLSWVLSHGHTLAYLGFAVVTGAAIVGDGATKHQHWGYGLLAIAIGVGALLVTILASDSPGQSKSPSPTPSSGSLLEISRPDRRR